MQFKLLLTLLPLAGLASASKCGHSKPVTDAPPPPASTPLPSATVPAGDNRPVTTFATSTTRYTSPPADATYSAAPPPPAASSSAAAGEGGGSSSSSSGGGGGGGGYQLPAPTTVSVTPHDKFSSSIGVLGCKVDTNRIAYWPSFPSCNSICVKLTSARATVHVLHIDQSGGAHDVSYDAWNELNAGQPAAKLPTYGGGVTVEAEYVSMDEPECAALLARGGGKLAFQAANSVNFVTSCPAGSWVANNYALYNIANSACSLGVDEKCTLDLAVSNQPSCAHQLGIQTKMTGNEVYDIAYGSGKMVVAQ